MGKQVDIAVMAVHPVRHLQTVTWNCELTPRLSVGKDPSAQVRIDAEFHRVSRKHLELVFESGQMCAIDLSKFGTHLNGQRMLPQSGMTIRPGDVLRLAEDQVDLKIGGVDASPAPIPEKPAAVAPRDVADFAVARREADFTALSALFTDGMMAFKRKIHEQVLAQFKTMQSGGQAIKDEALKEKVEPILDRVLREFNYEIPEGLDRALVRQALLDEFVGFGPITPMLRDPSVDEIMVNGPLNVFIERKGLILKVGARFFDDQHLMNIIQRIVAPIGRHVDEASPMVDARLNDGSRVNAIIRPLAIDGASVTIRKFKKEKLMDTDLVRFGSMTPEMAQFLREAVRSRQNIIVAGGTGSGKTTLLNLLSQYIPSSERVVTIEDTAELKLDHEDLVRLQSRPPNAEDKGRVTIRDLVINALRMRPDRIIVGECRGAEALDMLQAMNTGHEGSLTTIHANSPSDTIMRLETMVMMAGFDLPSLVIRQQIASAIDLIVQQSRMPDGSRKIVQINEITRQENGVVQMQEIFGFRKRGFVNHKIEGEFYATGNRPVFIEELNKSGDLNLDLSIFNPKPSRLENER